MNKLWIPLIFLISFFLLGLIKSRELSSVAVYFKPDKVLKIAHLSKVKATLPAKDQDLFELWESMLTGRTAPLASWIKERYRLLTLSHLFTPSGFHLTAVLMPVMKFVKAPLHQVSILIVIGIMLSFLSGMGALKRMILIKTHQKIFGLKTGFIFALILDMLLGTFQDSTLSFSYSFLFLGLIYSGKKGLPLIIYLFSGQMLIAYFQDVQLSPLLILLSPILNLCFGLAMPFLFILAIPMWSWQVTMALKILWGLQMIVDISAQIVSHFPVIEVSIMTLALFLSLYLHQRKPFYIGLIIFSGSLNVCQLKTPSLGSYEYKPQGDLIKIVSKDLEDVVYFEDGKCKRRLVNGIWWEKCSPRRKSTRKNKFKRLSFPT